MIFQGMDPRLQGACLTPWGGGRREGIREAHAWPVFTRDGGRLRPRDDRYQKGPAWPVFTR